MSKRILATLTPTQQASIFPLLERITAARRDVDAAQARENEAAEAIGCIIRLVLDDPESEATLDLATFEVYVQDGKDAAETRTGEP